MCVSGGGERGDNKTPPPNDACSSQEGRYITNGFGAVSTVVRREG